MVPDASLTNVQRPGRRRRRRRRRWRRWLRGGGDAMLLHLCWLYADIDSCYTDDGNWVTYDDLSGPPQLTQKGCSLLFQFFLKKKKKKQQKRRRRKRRRRLLPFLKNKRLKLHQQLTSCPKCHKTIFCVPSSGASSFGVFHLLLEQKVEDDVSF